MPTERLKLIVSPPPVAPSGAILSAHLAGLGFLALRAIGRGSIALWRALEAHGQRRAAHELLRVADLCEGAQPERARLLRDAAFAAQQR